MKKFLLSLSCVLSFALVGCGGGGGGSGDAPASAAAPVFSITGNWTAMSAGGIYGLVLDEAAGSLSYARPDEVTGATSNVSISGMRRGADGAYIFSTGLTVGGLALDVKLYRVDDNTLAGQIWSTLGGASKLTPVIASRSVVTDFSAINGNYSGSWLECDYSLADKRCNLGPGVTWQGYRDSVNFNALVMTACSDTNLNIAACAPADQGMVTFNALGGGVYAAGPIRVLAFPVGGQNLVFSHLRLTDTGTVYVGGELYAREADLPAATLNGTWRVATAEGRTGVATINGNDVTIQVEGLPVVTGTVKRNTPWTGLAQIEIAGESKPYYVSGNAKVLFAASDAGAYLLHRP